MAPPFREAEFDIMYGEGISREGEIVDLAVKLDIIKNPAPGTATREPASVRAEIRSSSILKRTRNLPSRLQSRSWTRRSA